MMSNLFYCITCWRQTFFLWLMHVAIDWSTTLDFTFFSILGRVILFCPSFGSPAENFPHLKINWWCFFHFWRNFCRASLLPQKRSNISLLMLVTISLVYMLFIQHMKRYGVVFILELKTFLDSRNFCKIIIDQIYRLMRDNFRNTRK